MYAIRSYYERLRGFDRRAVRAVGTNTLRVAKNSAAFLKKAEAALGFPIEVITQDNFLMATHFNGEPITP